MGLILFMAARTMLCFGFVTKTMLLYRLFLLLLGSVCTASRLPLFLLLPNHWIDQGCTRGREVIQADTIQTVQSDIPCHITVCAAMQWRGVEFRQDSCLLPQEQAGHLCLWEVASDCLCVTYLLFSFSSHFFAYKIINPWVFSCLLLLFRSVDVSKQRCSAQLPTGVNPQLCVMAKPKRIHTFVGN